MFAGKYTLGDPGVHSCQHMVATAYKPIEYNLELWGLLYCMSLNEGFQE